MLHSDHDIFYTNPLKSETDNSSAFERLSDPTPYDNPAHFKQLSVPTTTASTGLQSILNDVTETSIWHQAFDNTLSCHPIMNVSNRTSVPTLNALLTSSYLHPASGMMAHTDATPTSLLLFHIKDGTVITTATHEPSLLLLYVHDNPAIMTALNAKNLLLFFVQNNLATMILSLLLLLCQDNSAIMTATNTRSLLLLYVHDNPAMMAAISCCLTLAMIQQL
jgi:hypothetical protein